MTAKTKEERDANLDALAAAADGFLGVELARIEDETKFLRTVLIARNAEKAGVINLSNAETAVQDELTDYLLVSAVGG